MKQKMLLVLVVSCLVIILGSCKKTTITSTKEQMWDTSSLLSSVPNYEDAGVTYTSNIKGIFFEGEDYEGKATKVFAYFGVPETEMPNGGYPAIILIHGGLGRAFPDWVKLWTDRGYIAIAPDFDAQMASGSVSNVVNNPNGGPNGYGVKASDLQGKEKDSWTYFSIASLMKVITLLSSMSNVNKDLIGATGISWGSYLLGILLGVDHRLAFAMPVYGAGYLNEDSTSELSSMFAAMDDSMQEKYVSLFDPAGYLSQCATPTFFIQGVLDPAFSPVEKQKAADLITKVDVQYAYRAKMTHGQEYGSTPIELFNFADSIVLKKETILKLADNGTKGTSISVKITNGVGIKKAILYWTSTSDYEIRQAEWYSAVVTIDNGVISGSIPQEATYAYLVIDDVYGNEVSSRFYTVGL